MPNILKDFPFEVRRAVLLKQADIKADKKLGKFSHKHTLVQIIKEWLGHNPQYSSKK